MNRTACYHNVTEFDPSWFSRTENCTSQFTDKFGIITEGFRAVSKLDPESLYLTWPKQWIWTQKWRIFRNTNERQTQNETECLQQSDALEQVQSKFGWNWTVLSILNNSQRKAAQVSCTGFSSKATELQSLIVWTESQLGSFYIWEKCTARFTDDFRYITHLIKNCST